MSDLRKAAEKAFRVWVNKATSKGRDRQDAFEAGYRAALEAEPDEPDYEPCLITAAEAIVEVGSA